MIDDELGDPEVGAVSKKERQGPEKRQENAENAERCGVRDER